VWAGGLIGGGACGSDGGEADAGGAAPETTDAPDLVGGDVSGDLVGPATGGVLRVTWGFPHGASCTDREVTELLLSLWPAQSGDSDDVLCPTYSTAARCELAIPCVPAEGAAPQPRVLLDGGGALVSGLNAREWTVTLRGRSAEGPRWGGLARARVAETDAEPVGMHLALVPIGGDFGATCYHDDDCDTLLCDLTCEPRVACTSLCLDDTFCPEDWSCRQSSFFKETRFLCQPPTCAGGSL